MSLTTSIGMAIAAGASVARAIGAGKTEQARDTATHTLIYGVVFDLWCGLRASGSGGRGLRKIGHQHHTRSLLTFRATMTAADKLLLYAHSESI